MKIIITENQYKKLLQERYINIPTDDIAPDISLEIWEEDEKLVLDTIVIPKEFRKQGIGTAVMNRVCEYADQVQKPLYLTPSTSYGGSSVARLKSFYKRFGFTENPNSGPFRHTLIRFPR